eukprot:scaffold22348_cov101-Isochrysis_galbana.AAC.3
MQPSRRPTSSAGCAGGRTMMSDEQLPETPSPPLSPGPLRAVWSAQFFPKDAAGPNWTSPAAHPIRMAAGGGGRSWRPGPALAWEPAGAAESQRASHTHTQGARRGHGQGGGPAATAGRGSRGPRKIELQIICKRGHPVVILCRARAVAMSAAAAGCAGGVAALLIAVLVQQMYPAGADAKRQLEAALEEKAALVRQLDTAREWARGV